MLAVEWTEPALADLIEAQEYYERVNLEAAKLLAQRVWDASKKLGEQPKIGRVGYIEGTREWVVQKTPYILVYRVQTDQIEILHTYHDRRNWRKP